jgi:hypothetical protein
MGGGLQKQPLRRLSDKSDTSDKSDKTDTSGWSDNSSLGLAGKDLTLNILLSEASDDDAGEENGQNFYVDNDGTGCDAEDWVAPDDEMVIPDFDENQFVITPIDYGTEDIGMPDVDGAVLLEIMLLPFLRQSLKLLRRLGKARSRERALTLVIRKRMIIRIISLWDFLCGFGEKYWLEQDPKDDDQPPPNTQTLVSDPPNQSGEKRKSIDGDGKEEGSQDEHNKKQKLVSFGCLQAGMKYWLEQNEEGDEEPPPPITLSPEEIANIGARIEIALTLANAQAAANPTGATVPRDLVEIQRVASGQYADEAMSTDGICWYVSDFQINDWDYHQYLLIYR